MSEDDYDITPPPKIKELPKNWVLKFDESDGYFYYNRTLKVKPTRTPIDVSEFQSWKIKVNKNCIMKIDSEGDPYYICKVKGEQTSSRYPPVIMNERFPNGIELLLTPPFFKELDEKKMVTIEKPEEKEKEKVKTELDAYLQALAQGIHCDEDTPCDKDHECDLENKKCVPKSDKSYYDDLKRHEEDGASFVGKSSTIQNLIDSIAAKKKKAKEDAAKEAAKEEKKKKAAKEEAAKQEEEKKKKAAKEEEDKKKKAADASQKKAAGAAQKKAAKEEKKEEDEKTDSELNVDDVLDPDYENLSALQKALMDCLVPK